MTSRSIYKAGGRRRKGWTFRVTALVFLSNCYGWYSLAFLEIAEYLPAHGKWWINPLFCFDFTCGFFFICQLDFISTQEISHFYPSNPTSHPTVGSGMVWASSCVEYSCWLRYTMRNENLNSAFSEVCLLCLFGEWWLWQYSCEFLFMLLPCSPLLHVHIHPHTKWHTLPLLVLQSQFSCFLVFLLLFLGSICENTSTYKLILNWMTLFHLVFSYLILETHPCKKSMFPTSTLMVVPFL